MKSIRIGCIKISDESSRSPGEGPEGKCNMAMSLSEHVLCSLAHVELASSKLLAGLTQQLYTGRCSVTLHCPPFRKVHPRTLP
jgi:hypothetical protein